MREKRSIAGRFFFFLSSFPSFSSPLQSQHRHVEGLHRRERVEHHEGRPVEPALRRAGPQEHRLAGEAIGGHGGDRDRSASSSGSGGGGLRSAWGVAVAVSVVVAPLRCCRGHSGCRVVLGERRRREPKSRGERARLALSEEKRERRKMKRKHWNFFVTLLLLERASEEKKSKKMTSTSSSSSSRPCVWVVVLGDFGRSPRMQYHALSLANQVRERRRERKRGRRRN